VPLVDGSWDVSWLFNQAGYLNGTAFPTLNGNSVITAHVYNADGKPGPFVGLPSLKWGDQVILHAYGSKYIYEVREKQEVLPNNLSPLEHKEGSWITLLTCKQYDLVTNSYLKRQLARAVLVKVIAE
jgi:LPXTG-site transpeptidase (sortase) family protein